MSDKETFYFLGFNFQQRLIAQLMTDTKFGESIIDILLPEYFKENKPLLLIMQIIKSSWTNDEVLLKYDTLSNRILGSKIVESETFRDLLITTVATIQELDVNDYEYTQKTAMAFCKQKALKKAMLEIDKIIQHGTLEDHYKCEEIIKQALEVGDNKDNSVNVFDSPEEALRDDFRKPIPTGIELLDQYMDGGLSRGELGCVLAPLGIGKAQPLSSKILTPNGWVLMSDIKIGDNVIGRDGNPTKVTGVFPQGIRPIYQVSFNDKTSVLCDEEHLWSVNTYNQRNRVTKKNGKNVKLSPDLSFKTMALKDIMKGNLKVGNQLKYKIPIVEPVNFTEQELPLDAYVLGIMLGDGTITKNNQPSFVTKDEEIIDNIRIFYPNITTREINSEVEKEIDGVLVLEKRSILRVNLLKSQSIFTNLGLRGCDSSNKFIPKQYLYNTVENRINLLQGLVDSDGYVHRQAIEISTVSEQLSIDIRELVLSLGGKISVRKVQGKYKKNGVHVLTKMYYRLSFSFPNNGVIPSRLERKLKNYNPRTKYRENKYIKNIEYSHEEEAQCIMVENPEHLYVTNDYIVTHNTTMITKIANTAQKLGYNVVQIFFEDSEKIIQRKHFACYTGIDINELSNNKEEVVNKLIEMKSLKGDLKLKKFPSDSTTMPIIKQYLRKLTASGFKPDLVLLDYIDCVVPSKHYDDALVGEGSVMRQFETLAAEMDFAAWCAIQGNRGSLTTEVVDTHQMGGSIRKAQIGHFILSIARSKEQKEVDKATLAILKSRFGRDGIVFPDSIYNNKTLEIVIKEAGVSNLELDKSNTMADQQRTNNDIMKAFAAIREKKAEGLVITDGN